MNAMSDLNSIQPNVNSKSIEVLNSHNDVSPSIEKSNNSKKSTFIKNWAEDKLTISLEANEKFENELNLNIESSDEPTSKSIMELAAEVKQKAIDDIKERIEQIAEELHKLQGQEDEASKEQTKLLQQQINDLTGQLLTIMSS
jgi:hypothetical protein